MKFKVAKVFFLLGFVLVFADFSYGQNILSSIVGEITDASGAGVPAAQVTVTNEGTGVSVQVTADRTGTYMVPDLFAGVYTIQVNKEGFEVMRITGIRVLSAETVRQGVVLKVGSVTQSVTVSGAAPVVHTDSTNVAGEVSARQLTDLPVMMQSIDAFVVLVPGGSRSGGAGQPEYGGGMNFGGTNYNVNGIAANDATNGRGLQASGLGLNSLPPPSSMQEMTVEMNSMGAEYRMQSTVNMVTKQGSNKFHGEAYEYNQNAKLQANTFALNAAAQRKPPYNLNQFGGNVGGPIWKDKAFFFMNFSGWRQRSYSVASLNYPDADMRGGNFGALCTSFVGGVCAAGAGTQLYNPLTGAAFPGNVIPASMITSQATFEMGYVPANTYSATARPGLPSGAPNYVGAVAIPRDYDVYEARLDWQISAKDTLTGYFNRNQDLPWWAWGGGPATYGNNTNNGTLVTIYHLAWARSISSNTINDIRLGWLNEPQHRLGQNFNIDPTSLFPQQVESDTRGLPDMSMTGYAKIGDVTSRDLGTYDPSLEILENFTHVHGHHTIKAGADLTDYEVYTKSGYAAMPTFGFSGVWTGNKGNPGQPQSVGNAWADFELGDAISSATSYTNLDYKMYDKDWELYVQDTWQATPKLMVYLGVRYTNQVPWRMRNNYWSAYNHATNKIIIPEGSTTPTLEGGMIPTLFNAFLPYLTTSAAVGESENLWAHDNHAWGPRIGLAYRPFGNSKTVLRGGYGVYYSMQVQEGEPLSSAGVVPWAGTSPGGAGAVISYSTRLPGKPTSTYLPDITFSNPFPSTLGGLQAPPSNPTLNVMAQNWENPVLQSWNLTLERQIGLSDMVRISYVGSQGHHFDLSGDVNIPLVQQPNVPTQTQRPTQPWSTISIGESSGKQNFDQLQVGYVRHFAKGLSAEAEYEWTRALTTSQGGGGVRAPQPEYPNTEYSNNNAVPRHRLVFNYIYELPVGRGRHYLTNAPGVVDGVLGGWRVAGVTQYQTGTPFSVGYSQPSTYVGWWGSRADRLSGVNEYAKQSGHDITDGVQWFNPAAFAPPQPWTWGDSQPYSLWGPGYNTWDLSVQKSFRVPIRGLEAPRLTFRADFLNAFNHFNLGSVSATIADTRDGGPAITTAGKIYAGASGNQSLGSGVYPRGIQLGLMFEF
jgi:hypothetical protein